MAADERKSNNALALNLSKTQNGLSAFSATAPTARRSNSPTRSYSRDMPGSSPSAITAAAASMKRGQSPSLSRKDTLLPIRTYSEENLASDDSSSSLSNRDPGHHSLLLTARGPSPSKSGSTSPSVPSLNMRLDATNLGATIGPLDPSAATARGPSPSLGAMVSTPKKTIGQRVATYLPASFTPGGLKPQAAPIADDEIAHGDIPSSAPPTFSLDDCPNIADLLESSPAGLITKTHRPPSPSTTTNNNTTKMASPQRVQATPQRRPQSPQFSPSLLSPAVSRPITPSKTLPQGKTGREPTEIWVSDAPATAQAGTTSAPKTPTPKSRQQDGVVPPGSPTPTSSSLKPHGFASTAAQLIKASMSPSPKGLFSTHSLRNSDEVAEPNPVGVTSTEAASLTPKIKKTLSPKLKSSGSSDEAAPPQASSSPAPKPSLTSFSKLVALFEPLELSPNLKDQKSNDFLVKLGASNSNSVREAEEAEKLKKQGDKESENQERQQQKDIERNKRSEEIAAAKKRGKLMNLITTATADTASLPVGTPMSPRGFDEDNEGFGAPGEKEPTTTVEVVKEELQNAALNHGVTESIIAEINENQQIAMEKEREAAHGGASAASSSSPSDKNDATPGKDGDPGISTEREHATESKADDALIAELVAAAANGGTTPTSTVSDNNPAHHTSSVVAPEDSSAKPVKAAPHPTATATLTSNADAPTTTSTAKGAQPTHSSGAATSSASQPPPPQPQQHPAASQFAEISAETNLAPEKKERTKWSPGFRDYVCGTLSGVGKVIAGYPFDSLKGRVQGGDFGGSVRRAFMETLRHEGILAFYQGVTIPAVNVCFVGGILFYVNGAIRNFQQPDGIEPYSYLQMFVAGFGGGAAVGICLAPVEVLKLRMQLLNKVAVEEALTNDAVKRRVARVTDAKPTIPAFQTTAQLIAAAQKKDRPTVAEAKTQSVASKTTANTVKSATSRPIINNIRSIAMSLKPVDFFAGLTPTLIRECGTFGIFFPLNEYLKRKIALKRDKLDLEMVARRQAEQKRARLYGLTEGRLGPNDIIIPQPCFTTRVLAAGIAGMLCWLPVYPVDQIKTKMQLNPAFTYKSWLHCGAEIVRNEGIKVGLYKGLAPCLVRAFPAYAAQYLLFEKLTERWRL